MADVLRTRHSEQGLKTVAVTSAVNGEGRTQTAVCMALTMMKTSSNRVLLIDSDLRQPSLHALGVADPSGDPAGGDPLDARIVALHPSLHVLLAGQLAPRPDSAPFSESLRLLLDQMTDSYDWLFVDTPPISLLDETDTFGHLTDGVIFVIGASTPFPTVERAIAKLDRRRLVGTVLADFDEPSARP
jgi:Mrp family chromosome partitioning ATPase